jgi:hypothetical protein
MNGAGLSVFRTISGDAHRTLVPDLRGTPPTAEANERALIERLRATCRYGHPE